MHLRRAIPLWAMSVLALSLARAAVPACPAPERLRVLVVGEPDPEVGAQEAASLDGRRTALPRQGDRKQRRGPSSAGGTHADLLWTVATGGSCLRFDTVFAPDVPRVAWEARSLHVSQPARTGSLPNLPSSPR